MVKIVPMDSLEERMSHDFKGVFKARSQPLFWFTGEQLLYEARGVSWHVEWIKWQVNQDGVIDLIFIFTGEGGLLEKHLIDENSECPPVYWETIFLAQ